MKVPGFKFGIPNVSKLTHGHKFNPGLGTLLRNINFPKPEPKTKDRQRFSRSQDLEKEFSKMYQRVRASFRKLTPHPFTPEWTVCAPAVVLQALSCLISKDYNRDFIYT